MNITPYGDVNDVVSAFKELISRALRENLVGIYLRGSLVTGDFDPNRSDIDFLVVTRDEVSEEKEAEIKAVHTRTEQIEIPVAKRLEGPYLSKKALWHKGPDDSLHFFFERSALERTRLERDWIIQQYITREFGLSVIGPPPADLIPLISGEELKAAAKDIFLNEWRPEADGPSAFKLRGRQAYAVLTVCRLLFTASTGLVVSKLAAARWARDNVGHEWDGLIRRAIDKKEDDGIDDADETVRFVRYVQALSFA